MAGVSYVVRRGAILYLRVRVPSDLTRVIGKTHVVRSLGTSDFRQGRLKAAQMLATIGESWVLILRDEKFWFFLVSHLTGARPEELTEAPATLVDLEGTLCLDLRRSGTKTGAAPRLVPILTELHRLGFVEWAKKKQLDGGYLFKSKLAPEDWSKWSNRYLDDIGLVDFDTVTYSFRHNFRQMLDASTIGMQLSDKIFGHKTKKTSRRYGKNLSPQEARTVVRNVKSPIPLDHLFLNAPLRDL